MFVVFFWKVVNYLQSREDTIQKDYQTFYGKIKCNLLNFRGLQIGYHQDFQYLMVSIPYFHEAATLMQSYMPDKLQSQKKIFFKFFWWKDITIPLTILKVLVLKTDFILRFKATNIWTNSSLSYFRFMYWCYIH